MHERGAGSVFSPHPHEAKTRDILQVVKSCSHDGFRWFAGILSECWRAPHGPSSFAGLVLLVSSQLISSHVAAAEPQASPAMQDEEPSSEKGDEKAQKPSQETKEASAPAEDEAANDKSSHPTESEGAAVGEKSSGEKPTGKPASSNVGKEKAAAPIESELGAAADRARANALERQAEAERAGNIAVARRLEALAAQWARVKEARIQATKREAAATQLEEENLELEARVARAVTLVEQTEARRARALARLRELDLDAQDAGIPLGKEKAQPGPEKNRKQNTGKEEVRPSGKEGGKQ